LTWGNQPQQGRGVYVTLESKLRFPLKLSPGLQFSFRPKDFFSGLFTSNKQKFGISELDKAYVFASNSPGLALELAELFRQFHDFNTYKKFVIETETVSEQPVVTIYIHELLTTSKKLAFYYNFGLRLATHLSMGNTGHR
jgi:hypothetical protein